MVGKLIFDTCFGCDIPWATILHQLDGNKGPRYQTPVADLPRPPLTIRCEIIFGEVWSTTFSYTCESYLEIPQALSQYRRGFLGSQKVLIKPTNAQNTKRRPSHSINENWTVG